MIQTEDVQFENMEQLHSNRFDSQLPKPMTEVTPRQMYGKTLPPLRNTKGGVKDRTQNVSNIRNSQGLAKVTATATVTVNLPVELKKDRKQGNDSNTAIVPRHKTQNFDMEVEDIEDEFV